MTNKETGLIFTLLTTIFIIVISLVIFTVNQSFELKKTQFRVLFLEDDTQFIAEQIIDLQRACIQILETK